MAPQRKLAQECSVEELDKELIVRGVQKFAGERFKFKDLEITPDREAIMAEVKEFYEAAQSFPPNPALAHLSTWEVAKALMFKTRTYRVEGSKGVWDLDNRKDFYQIEDEQIKENANCVAALCMKDDLMAGRNGYIKLKTKNFGKAFNLCKGEPFYDQPIAAGRLCTGFLVKEDIIATAAHCLYGISLSQMRFLFGFKMLDSSTPATQVPDKDIYQGIKVLERVHNRKGNKSDWALVKLDRKVVGHPVVKFPGTEVTCSQPVYVIGHPCGLPLKYADGASVQTIENAFFSADLDVFSGNSGSPVFSSDTHKLVGIAVRGDTRDFRWTGKGWMYIKYPHPNFKSKLPQCTRFSEFIEYCG
jgi:hypothetical protein